MQTRQPSDRFDAIKTLFAKNDQQRRVLGGPCQEVLATTRTPSRWSGIRHELPRILPAAAVVAYAAPALLALRGVRRQLFPQIAGLGRPNHVALTFDDGPDPASTPLILDALSRLGWHGTFFMLGEMAQRHRETARRVVAEGHEVALHGPDHRNLLLRPPLWPKRWLARGLDQVHDATGVAPVWYRPAYGILNQGVMSAAEQAGLGVVLWTAWGRDWRAAATPASVVTDVRQGMLAGATVLLHDSDCTSAPESWRSTLGALPLLAREWDDLALRVGPLRDHGLAPVRVPAALFKTPSA